MTEIKALTYVCSFCGAKGVQLWRETHIIRDAMSLFCKACKDKHEAKKGNWELVPAVPDVKPDVHSLWRLPKNASYWGCTSVPAVDYAWWASLPVVEGGPATHVEPDPEALAFEAKIAAHRADFPNRVDAYCKATEFVVEASSAEYHFLWAEVAPESDRTIHKIKSWEQINEGFVDTIEHVWINAKRMPITISVFWAKLDGHMVAFYESPSVVTDRDRVEKYLWSKMFPHLKDKDRRVDASGFHNCLRALGI